jgi:hypothetical protein
MEANSRLRLDEKKKWTVGGLLYETAILATGVAPCELPRSESLGVYW